MVKTQQHCFVLYEAVFSQIFLLDPSLSTLKYSLFQLLYIYVVPQASVLGPLLFIFIQLHLTTSYLDHHSAVNHKLSFHVTSHKKIQLFQNTIYEISSNRLQLIFNSSVRASLKYRNTIYHVTPRLKSLHWLKITKRNYPLLNIQVI